MQELQLQVFYSILDQVYHGQHPLGGSTIEILEKVQNTYYSLPYVSGTVRIYFDFGVIQLATDELISAFRHGI